MCKANAVPVLLVRALNRGQVVMLLLCCVLFSPKSRKCDKSIEHLYPLFILLENGSRKCLEYEIEIDWGCSYFAMYFEEQTGDRKELK